MPIDAEGHPHIIDQILLHAPRATLLRFRGTSKAFHKRIDALFLPHVIVRIGPHLDVPIFDSYLLGRLPLLPARKLHYDADPVAHYAAHYCDHGTRLEHITTVDARVVAIPNFALQEWEGKRHPLARAQAVFSNVATVRVHGRRGPRPASNIPVVEPTPGRPQTLIVFDNEPAADSYGRMDARFWGFVDMSQVNKLTKRVRWDTVPLQWDRMTPDLALPAGLWPKQDVVIFVQFDAAPIPRITWSPYALRAAAAIVRKHTAEKLYNFPRGVPRPQWTLVDLDAVGDISDADALERVWLDNHECPDYRGQVTAQIEEAVRPRLSLLTRDQYAARVGAEQFKLETEE
ncbi:uncharacterized protein LOC62_03G003654 [Vanrija pseudolonga]|uniref:Uncharacterized protein n=1 Tax=Vanrija pseudolonga TaxID=143232 RepID=A0AAF1BHE9_9TREE|nr:hypothetical protein LOC62_03G003654 [Vanrija pseudolonga]